MQDIPTKPKVTKNSWVFWVFGRKELSTRRVPLRESTRFVDLNGIWSFARLRAESPESPGVLKKGRDMSGLHFCLKTMGFHQETMVFGCGILAS
jgi:hypothetical protein